MFGSETFRDEFVVELKAEARRVLADAMEHRDDADGFGTSLTITAALAANSVLWGLAQCIAKAAEKRPASVGG